MTSSDRAHRGGRARVAAALIVAVSCAGAPATGAAAPPEYEVKAEFLERFTRFIEWPTLPARGPFVIGIYGANPFGGYLDRLVRERTVKGRPAVVRQLTRLDEIGGCHLLFVARDRRAELREVLARTGGKPILTIGDTPGFGQGGILINFYLEQRFVRFELNVSAIKASGLKASPKLLRLGRVVGGSR